MAIVAPAMLSRASCAAVASHIKKCLMAAEPLRTRRRAGRSAASGTPSASRACASSRSTHLVFLDETYVNTKMTRLRGRSRKGQRLRASASLSAHWKTHNPSWPRCAVMS